MYLIHKQQKKLFYLGECKLRFSFFFFKQLPLNTEQKFEFACQLIDGERLLSVVVGVVGSSADNPLDFHGTIVSVLRSLFKV